MSENKYETKEKPLKEDQDLNQNEIKGPQEEDPKPQEEEPKENNIVQAPKENKKIFVRNIPFNTTDTQLSDFFSRFAAVEKVEIMKKDDGTSSGLGFVEFSTMEEKKNVLSMNGDDLIIDGRRLDIKEAKLDRMDYRKTLYVGNLSSSTNEETLRKFFIDNVQDLKGDFKVNLQTKYNGKPKGHAYLEFENEEDISNALKIDGLKLDDKALIVEMKKSRGIGGSHGRVRGRFQGGIGRRGGLGGRRYYHGRDNYYRDRSRGRSRSHERSRERSRERDKERYRRRDRDRDRERYRERERERERDRDRDRERIERDRNRVDRERERERDRGEGDRGDRERERERGDRDRERDIERRHIAMDRNQA